MAKTNELLKTVLGLLAEECKAALEKAENGERIGYNFYIQSLKRVKDFGPAWQFEMEIDDIESGSHFEKEVLNCISMIERVSKVIAHNVLERDDLSKEIEKHPPE